MARPFSKPSAPWKSTTYFLLLGSEWGRSGKRSGRQQLTGPQRPRIYVALACAAGCAVDAWFDLDVDPDDFSDEQAILMLRTFGLIVLYSKIVSDYPRAIYCKISTLRTPPHPRKWRRSKTISMDTYFDKRLSRMLGSNGRHTG